MIRLLFVDDDVNILKINQIYFEKAGCQVWIADSESAALELLQKQSFDCLILDILLTDTPDGYRFCQTIKSSLRLPVIFLTSLTEQDALYRGFTSGGDDFITKPYDIKELELRILARVNRVNGVSNPGATLLFPPLLIDTVKRRVSVQGTEVCLTSSEFDILLLLAQSPEQVFSLEDIYRKVWQMPDLDSTHTVQVHVGRMRRKIYEAYPDHDFIATAWGKGYLFSPL